VKEGRVMDPCSQLEKYAVIFGDKNRNPFVQIRLGGYILSHVIPRVIHGFVNGLADMVHSKRKCIFPDCDQESDWFKSERVFYKNYFGEGIVLLAIKCVLLAAYCDCIKAGHDLPGIDSAMQPLGVCDEKVIETLEKLDKVQCGLLFQSACEVSLSNALVELFLRREIAQLYIENEGEIMNEFAISC
jgi:hypothetical protein